MKIRLSKQFVVGVAVLALAAMLVVSVSAAGFVHGIVLNVDGTDYYLDGAPDGPEGAFDIPRARVEPGRA